MPRSSHFNPVGKLTATLSCVVPLAVSVRPRICQVNIVPDGVLGVAALAVYSLRSTVKYAGFDRLLLAMAPIACCMALIVTWLPDEPAVAPAPGPT